MNQDCNNDTVNRYVDRSLMFDQQNNEEQNTKLFLANLM